MFVCIQAAGVAMLVAYSGKGAAQFDEYRAGFAVPVAETSITVREKENYFDLELTTGQVRREITLLKYDPFSDPENPRPSPYHEFRIHEFLKTCG